MWRRYGNLPSSWSSSVILMQINMHFPEFTVPGRAAVVVWLAVYYIIISSHIPIYAVWSEISGEVDCVLDYLYALIYSKGRYTKKCDILFYKTNLNEREKSRLASRCRPFISGFYPSYYYNVRI